MNEITITIKKEELESLLIEYYKNIYVDTPVTIDIKSSYRYASYYETKEVYTEIKLKRNFKIAGFNAECTETIDLNNIKDILKVYLDASGYEIGDVYLETKEECINFYDDKRVVFKGLKVQVKNKNSLTLRK